MSEARRRPGSSISHRPSQKITQRTTHYCPRTCVIVANSKSGVLRSSAMFDQLSLKLIPPSRGAGWLRGGRYHSAPHSPPAGAVSIRRSNFSLEAEPTVIYSIGRLKKAPPILDNIIGPSSPAPVGLHELHARHQPSPTLWTAQAQSAGWRLYCTSLQPRVRAAITNAIPSHPNISFCNRCSNFPPND